MKKFIVMTCGYCEDAMVSVMIYQCVPRDQPYATAKEAITELALDMYAKFVDEYLKEGEILEVETFADMLKVFNQKLPIHMATQSGQRVGK